MTSLRERIAAAAQQLYLQEGLDGVTMRRVARAVGVSAPALYRHYRSKDELLDEIMKAGLRILEDYLKPALEARTSYRRLVELTENYLRFALEQPQYFDFAFLLPGRSLDRVREEIDKPPWATFRMAVDQVAACMAEGIFRADDPLETAVTIWAEAHGLVTLFRTGRFGPDTEIFRQTYRRSVHQVLDGLTTEPPGRGVRRKPPAGVSDPGEHDGEAPPWPASPEGDGP